MFTIILTSNTSIRDPYFGTLAVLTKHEFFFRSFLMFPSHSLVSKQIFIDQGMMNDAEDQAFVRIHSSHRVYFQSPHVLKPNSRISRDSSLLSVQTDSNSKSVLAIWDIDSRKNSEVRISLCSSLGCLNEAKIQVSESDMFPCHQFLFEDVSFFDQKFSVNLEITYQDSLNSLKDSITLSPQQPVEAKKQSNVIIFGNHDLPILVLAAASSLQVVWNGNSSAVESIQLSYRKKVIQEWKTNASSNHLEITNLAPDTEYMIKVLDVQARILYFKRVSTLYQEKLSDDKTHRFFFSADGFKLEWKIHSKTGSYRYHASRISMSNSSTTDLIPVLLTASDSVLLHQPQVFNLKAFSRLTVLIEHFYLDPGTHPAKIERFEITPSDLTPQTKDRPDEHPIGKTNPRLFRNAKFDVFVSLGLIALLALLVLCLMGKAKRIQENDPIRRPEATEHAFLLSPKLVNKHL